MARIRYLKPDFFKDEDLAALPLVERLTFAGLWCHADREGRLEYRPRYLKAEIWPYEDTDMETALTHLAAPGIPGRPDKAFIVIYEVGGRRFIQIIEFLKHQKPHHTERDSTIPLPNGDLTVKPPLSDGENPVGMGMEKGMGKKKGALEGSPVIQDPYVATFDQFWNIYPHRNGNKIGKAETLSAIKNNISLKDLPSLIQATKHFAANPDAKKGIGVKDPQRFIICGRGKDKSHPWREWVNPEKKSTPSNSIPEYKRQYT